MRFSNFRRAVLWAGIAFSLLVLTGCEQKTINEILADPGRYGNKEVAVLGTVRQSYSVMGAGAYEIEDDTARLWVIAKKGVPRKGARIVVKGTIRDGVNLGSLVPLPSPISTGVVMMEVQHKAK